MSEEQLIQGCSHSSRMRLPNGQFRCLAAGCHMVFGEPNPILVKKAEEEDRIARGPSLHQKFQNDFPPFATVPELPLNESTAAQIEASVKAVATEIPKSPDDYVVLIQILEEWRTNLTTVPTSEDMGGLAEALLAGGWRRFPLTLSHQDLARIAESLIFELRNPPSYVVIPPQSKPSIWGRLMDLLR